MGRIVALELDDIAARDVAAARRRRRGARRGERAALVDVEPAAGGLAGPADHARRSHGYLAGARRELSRGFAPLQKKLVNIKADYAKGVDKHLSSVFSEYTPNTHQIKRFIWCIFTKYAWI